MKIIRNNQLRRSVKKCVLKNLAKFTVKHLFWSLILIKFHVWGLELYYQRDSKTVFSCDFQKNF